MMDGLRVMTIKKMNRLSGMMGVVVVMGWDGGALVVGVAMVI